MPAVILNEMLFFSFPDFIRTRDLLSFFFFYQSALDFRNCNRKRNSPVLEI